MKNIKFEEKFLVINFKHLFVLLRTHPELMQQFLSAYKELAKHIPKNKYYVCNQDEPYAEEVLRVILNGEEKKQNPINNNKSIKCDWCGRYKKPVNEILLDKKEYLDSYTRIIAQITVARSYSPDGHICMDCLRDVMLKWLVKGE